MDTEPIADSGVPTPGEPGATAAPVDYELDLDAPSSSSEGPGASTPATAAASTAPGPAAPDPLVEIQQLRRQLNELHSQFDPLVQERQRTLLEAEQRPPITMERLTSGEATVPELLSYLEWQRKQDLASLSRSLSTQTRVAHSEAQARGQFTAEALGAPERSYDQLRATYLEPAYAQDPSLRQHVFALVPDNPALAEMWAATILHARDRHKGNDLVAIRAVMDAVNARADGAAETAQKIQEAARRGADLLVRDRGPGATRVKLTSQDIWKMSDAEFDELQRQKGVG